MGLKPIIRGILTYVPSLSAFVTKRTGGTNSARYCYSVWLRHLVMAQQHGLATQPQVIAELGPGDSLGIGLAALLSGAESYYALDIVDYANTQANLVIFHELVNLFLRKELIPDEQEFPALRPLLESYEFPREILTDERLAQSLSSNRIQLIAEAISGTGDSKKRPIGIHYIVPWYDDRVIRAQSVDMIFSQAVLEHVDNLTQTYQSLHRWLKADGFMSHQIDFGCHGLAKKWNGHWAYSDLAWKIVRGKRSYLLNRYPYSVHKRLLEQCGFNIVAEVKTFDDSGLARAHLSSSFQAISDEDLTTRTVHILAWRTRDERRTTRDESVRGSVPTMGYRV